MVRSINLEPCLVYRPTESEFVDPIKFISSIRSEASRYGICKIIPPDSWNPPFALEWSKFQFSTKVQSVHQLQERPAGCDPDTFRLEYSKFCSAHGLQLVRFPLLENRELDLCKLYNSVRRRGGHKRVCKEKKWGDVHKLLHPDKSMAAHSRHATLQELQSLYEIFLAPYEQYHCDPASTVAITSQHKHQFLAKQKLPGHSSTVKKLEEKRGEGKAKKAEESLPPAPKEAAMVSLAGEEQKIDQRCQQCHGGDHEDSMLLCDRCDKGWHLYCLSPPLSEVPQGNWYCFECLRSEKEAFGFSTGEEHTLGSFRLEAEKFKKEWFGGAEKVKPSHIENEFWRIVEKSSQEVEVLYGSDIDTSVSGSGFPREVEACLPGRNKEAWEKYVKSPWNLNNIAKHKGSVLGLVEDDIPGVIVPWLYVGMTFSTFCWHYEDQSLYSINYMHWGDRKQWYSVPGYAAESFERIMKESFPDLFESQPDLLFQLVTMLNPMVLKENNIPVYSCLQGAREFVVTFPRSYHGGFNHGFNCAEAVNFAPLDWLPWGRCAVDRYKMFRRSSVLSHEELLCVVTRSGMVDREECHWLESELQHLILRERNARNQLWLDGTVRSVRMAPRNCPDRVTEEEDTQCIICKYYLHLSAVTCACRPGDAVCLQHSQQLCECKPRSHILHYRYSMAELEDMLQSVEDLQKTAVPSPSAASPATTCHKRRRSSARIAPQRHLYDPVQDLPPVDLQKKFIKGRFLSHEEMADLWTSRASLARPTLRAVHNFLEEAEEFLWGSHGVDAARELAARLSAGREWASKVAAAYELISGASSMAAMDSLPADGGSSVTLETLESLVFVDPVPCLEPFAPKIKALLKRGSELRDRIRNLLESQPPVEHTVLESIYEEASQFPVPFSQLKVLRESLTLAHVC